MWNKLALLFLLPLFPLLATQEMPWFAQPFEIQLRSDIRYQHYATIQRPKKNISHTSDDFFFHLSTQVSPWQDIDAEIELYLAHTPQQQFSFDSLLLTGRYLLYDDVLTDPLSITLGTTLIKVWKHATQDPSTFHHSRLEAEFHVAIGKEFPNAPTWHSRIWTFLAYGISDSGSPWYRANFAWEKNFCDHHIIRLFTNTLWGAGKEAFPKNHFKSYGPIHHQSVDIGLRYFYLIPYFGNFNLSYAYRAYAKNAPAHTHNLLLQLTFVVSL